MKNKEKQNLLPALYGLTVFMAVQAHDLSLAEKAVYAFLGADGGFPVLRALLGALCAVVLALYAARRLWGSIQKKQPLLGCALLMFGTLALMTLLYGGASGYWLSWAAGLALMLVLDMGLQRERAGTLSAFSLALLIWVCLNLPARLLAPQGLNGPDPSPLFVPRWLLGNRAFYYRIAFPALGFEMIRAQEKAGRYTLRTALVFAAVTLTVALQGGGTALMGYAVFLGMLLLFGRRALPRFATPAAMLALSAALFIGLHFLHVQGGFEWLIEDMLEKDLTLTNRTDVWTAALEIIKKHPVTGVGLLPVAYKKQLLGYSHTHNQVLELLLHGGLLALLPYLGMVWLSSRQALRFGRCAAVRVAAILLMTFVFMGTVEMFHNDPLYYPLFMLLFRSEQLQGGRVSQPLTAP